MRIQSVSLIIINNGVERMQQFEIRISATL